MGDSIAERMDAGWQAARHWETECEAARAERDALAAQLAALKKRVADAARRIECTPEGGTVMYALVPLDPVGHTTCTPARLEDGE